MKAKRFWVLIALLVIFSSTKNGTASFRVGDVLDLEATYKIACFICKFKGKVGFSPAYDPEIYLRAQFMEKIRGIE